MNGVLETLVRSAPSAVIGLDAQGKIAMMNAGAEDLLGVHAEQAVGRSYEAVFGPSLADRVLRLFLHTMRSREATEPRLLRVTVPSGRRAELRASMGPIRDASGAFSGLLFVADEERAEGVTDDGQVTERLRVALRRYLGEAIAELVERRPSFVGVGGVRQHVSLVHADIRGYTTVAEALEPEAVAEVLLRYHGRAVTALQGEGATLDRFIGDSVLAIWNAPLTRNDHARAAIRGALALQAAVSATGSELAYGVGVHTGDAIVGNVGNESFLNYTAVGDCVNVAARLQAQAGRGEVLCSEGTLREAGAGVHSTALGAIPVKGRREPVQAHRVLAIEGDPL